MAINRDILLIISHSAQTDHVPEEKSIRQSFPPVADKSACVGQVSMAQAIPKGRQNLALLQSVSLLGSKIKAKGKAVSLIKERLALVGEDTYQSHKSYLENWLYRAHKADCPLCAL
ncbi:MAG: hypothetical protein ABSB11_06770 [Sedimentisphaerales bacterium]|jgi:hypothetical protein